MLIEDLPAGYDFRYKVTDDEVVELPMEGDESIWLVTPFW